MIEEEDEILKSLQKLAVFTGEGQEVKKNQITEFLVNSVCYAVESRCGIRDDTLDFFLLSAVFRERGGSVPDRAVGIPFIWADCVTDCKDHEEHRP